MFEDDMTEIGDETESDVWMFEEREREGMMIVHEQHKLGAREDAYVLMSRKRCSGRLGNQDPSLKSLTC